MKTVEEQLAGSVSDIADYVDEARRAAGAAAEDFAAADKAFDAIRDDNEKWNALQGGYAPPSEWRARRLVKREAETERHRLACLESDRAIDLGHAEAALAIARKRPKGWKAGDPEPGAPPPHPGIKHDAKWSVSASGRVQRRG